MDESGGRADPPAVDQPSVSPDADALDADPPDPLPAADAFQALASEVRVAVLLELHVAERAGADPPSFTDLQRAVEADTSAGFAYHLRQLSGDFVRQTEAGYVLTPLGRRAARAIADGTFTGGDPGQAS